MEGENSRRALGKFLLVCFVSILWNFGFGQSGNCSSGLMVDDCNCVKTKLRISQISIKKDLELVENYTTTGYARMADPPPITRRLTVIVYSRYKWNKMYDLLLSEEGDTFLLAHTGKVDLAGKSIHLGISRARDFALRKKRRKVKGFIGMEGKGFLEVNGGFIVTEGKWKRVWHFWFTKWTHRFNNWRFKSRGWKVVWVLIPFEGN